MTETLHDCPNCGRGKFTDKGLRAHRCRPAVAEAGLPTVAPKLPQFPVTVTGTWDGARRWRDGATAMEKGKLFCQVMLGFELVALRASIGLRNGGDRKTEDGKSHSQAGNVIWAQALESELGLSKTTAYRLIEMAEAAKPRLKKTPALRDFDPTTQPVASLPAPQQEALESAVKKLTDGSTQVEFMRELGLAKIAQGGGAKGRAKGEGGRKKLSPSEEAELLREIARDDWHALEGNLLGAYRSKFCFLSDPEVNAQVAALEKALEARKAWLKTKPEARDAQVIETRFDA